MFVLCWFGCCCFVYLCLGCLCVALLSDFGLNLVFAFADCVLGFGCCGYGCCFVVNIGFGDCGLVGHVCLCCVIVLHWCWWVVLACGDLRGCFWISFWDCVGLLLWWYDLQCAFWFVGVVIGLTGDCLVGFGVGFTARLLHCCCLLFDLEFWLGLC